MSPTTTMPIGVISLMFFFACGDDAMGPDIATPDAFVADAPSSDARTDVAVSDASSSDVLGMDSSVVDAGDDTATPLTFVSNTLKASPIAHGFGRFASGGRGLPFYNVTTLDNDGAGSFRRAFSEYPDGCNITFFGTSGNIELTSMLFINGKNFTVWGSTSPRGIAIHSPTWGISLQRGNNIWENFRFRGSGDGEGSNRSNLRIHPTVEDIENVVILHSSFSWANPNEMNIDLGGDDEFSVSNTTVQDSILAGVDRNVLNFRGSFSLSVLRTYLGPSNQRGVRNNFPDEVPADRVDFEQINTITHGFSVPPIQASLGSKFTVLNSLNTESEDVAQRFGEMIRFADTGLGVGTPANTYAYIDGNANEVEPSRIQRGFDDYLESSALEASDYESIMIEVDDLEETIVPYLGARWYDSRDAADAAFVEQLATRTGSYVIDGTLPSLEGEGEEGRDDTDGDGLPDWFEDAYGLDKNDAGDAFETTAVWSFDGVRWENAAGYTNAEAALFRHNHTFEILATDWEPDEQ